MIPTFRPVPGTPGGVERSGTFLDNYNNDLNVANDDAASSLFVCVFSVRKGVALAGQGFRGPVCKPLGQRGSSANYQSQLIKGSRDSTPTSRLSR